MVELLAYDAPSHPDHRRGIPDIPLAGRSAMVVADPAIDLVRPPGLERRAKSRLLMPSSLDLP
ncbi:MAG: hypothetical protein AB1698_04895 [Pseudomonadota bacterium]